MVKILRRDNSGSWHHLLGDTQEPGGGIVTPPAFQLGITQPTIANTGIRVPESSLQNYAGSLTNIGSGQTIKNLAITGIMDFGTGDGPGIIEDCLVLYGQPPVWPSSDTQANTHWGLRAWGNHNGLTFNHCEWRPNDNYLSHDIAGPQGGGRLSPNCPLTFYRCYIHKTVDGMVLHGAASVRKQWKVHGCLIRDLRFYQIDPRQGPEGSHNDGIQSEGNSENVEVIGNTIFGGVTSCILFTNNINGGYKNILVRDNWFIGHSTSGSSINWAGSHVAGTNPVEGVTITRNRVSTSGKTPGILINTSVRSLSTTNLGLDLGGTGNPVRGSANGNDYTCNVQMDPTTFEVLRDGSGFVVPYTVSNG